MVQDRESDRNGQRYRGQDLVAVVLELEYHVRVQEHLVRVRKHSLLLNVPEVPAHGQIICNIVTMAQHSTTEQSTAEHSRAQENTAQQAYQ